MKGLLLTMLELSDNLQTKFVKWKKQTLTPRFCTAASGVYMNAYQQDANSFASFANVNGGDVFCKSAVLKTSHQKSAS